MIYTNLKNLPPPVYRMVALAEHNTGSAHFSVTELLDSPRVKFLERKYDPQLTVDVSTFANAALGNGADKHFKDHSESPEIAGLRLGAIIEVDGVEYEINGEFDWYDSTQEWLVDLKTPGTYEWFFPKAEREAQLNVYRFLILVNAQAPNSPVFGGKVSRMSNCFIFKGHTPKEAKYKKGYPSSIDQRDVPIWPIEQTREFIKDRIRLHRDATDDTLCSDEERWMDNRYAVVPIAGGRAVNGGANFDDHESAEAFRGTLKDPSLYEVEHRLGEPKRCIDWCSVGMAGLCEQWNGEQS